MYTFYISTNFSATRIFCCCPLTQYTCDIIIQVYFVRRILFRVNFENVVQTSKTKTRGRGWLCGRGAESYFLLKNFSAVSYNVRFLKIFFSYWPCDVCRFRSISSRTCKRQWSTRRLLRDQTWHTGHQTEGRPSACNIVITAVTAAARSVSSAPLCTHTV